jgi:ADP-ribose pyrophosphatase
MKRKLGRARVLRSRRVFRGRVFSVRRDVVLEPAPGIRGRRKAVREIVEHAGSVVVLPIASDGRILLVRQYRHATRGFLWELVAGGLETGESPRAAAARELEEETGYRAQRFHKLAEFFPTPGFLSERMHLYRATGLRPGPSRPEADESLQPKFFPGRELGRMLARGRLRDGKTLVGVLLELGRRRRGGSAVT